MVTTTDETNTPEETAITELSNEEQLLRDIEGWDELGNVRNKIQESTTASKNFKIILPFIKLVDDGDSIAAERISLEREFGGVKVLSEKEARELWLKIEALEEWRQHLQNWADNGHDAASTILQRLGAFQAKLPYLLDTAWRVVCEIERPTRYIHTYGALVPFLKSLQEKGLARMVINPVQTGKQAIVILYENESQVWFPTQDKIASAGWYFVQEAGKRAKERDDQLIEECQQVDESATPGLKPKDISAENVREQVLVVRLHYNRRVIFTFDAENGNVQTRVDTVGITIRPRPSLPVLLIPEDNYRVLRGNRWPVINGDPDFCAKALQAIDNRNTPTKKKAPAKRAEKSK